MIVEISRDTTTLLGKPLADLEKALSEGYSRRAACERAGVSYYTFRDWMQRGGDTTSRSVHRCPADVIVEPYHSFVRAILAAERIGKTVQRPRRNPTGPPPGVLSTEQRQAIIHGFQQGWTSREVAAHAGIRHTTLLGWLHRGGYPNLRTAHVPLEPSFVTEPYKSFVEEVLRAEDAFFTGS